MMVHVSASQTSLEIHRTLLPDAKNLTATTTSIALMMKFVFKVEEVNVPAWMLAIEASVVLMLSVLLKITGHLVCVKMAIMGIQVILAPAVNQETMKIGALKIQIVRERKHVKLISRV